MSFMGKIVVHIPLVTWRDGRPRFIPGPSAQALGYKGEDLRHGKAGAWFTLDEAIAWSTARQGEIAQKRASITAGATTPAKARRQVRQAARAGLVTVGHVVSDYLEKNPAMLGVDSVVGKRRRYALAPNTVRYYRGAARLLEQFDSAAVWQAPAVQLTGRALGGILQRIEERHGLAQARAVRALLQGAFKWGRKQNLVGHDPVAGLEDPLPMPVERVRPGTVQEIVTFIAGCDALGWPEIGDAIALGVWTAQRQGDRLIMREAQIGLDGLEVQAGKKNRGGKRETLLIPIGRVLAARFAAAKERRKGFGLNSDWLILNERLRLPFEVDWYRKVFRQLRHAIAHHRLERYPAGHAQAGKATLNAISVFAGMSDAELAQRLSAAGLKPLASLADLRDQDLRDTCLSWLPLAGADKWEVAGFSGHAFGKSDSVLKHYLAIPPQFARSGLAKLEAWYAAQLTAIEQQRPANTA